MPGELKNTVLRICSARVYSAIVIGLALLGTVGVTTADEAQTVLPVIDLRVGEVPLTVELAVTGTERYMGLSFRESLSDDAGMLFVYEREKPLSFTMRNTLIPLSIAFLSKDMLVNEIHKMDVGPGQVFNAEKPAQYALEVNQGWFAKHDIKPGTRITK
ncbi:MAG: DUF192 domain-containing protein [Granulosicoccus sp.]